jgi:hypothetical protein
LKSFFPGVQVNSYSFKNLRQPAGHHLCTLLKTCASLQVSIYNYSKKFFSGVQVNIYWVKDTMRLQPNPRYTVMPTGKMRGETQVGGNQIIENLLFPSPEFFFRRTV